MAKRNTWDGFCGVCGSQVRALEGLVEAVAPGEGYRILCPEHAPAGVLDPPKPPEVSQTALHPPRGRALRTVSWASCGRLTRRSLFSPPGLCGQVVR